MASVNVPQPSSGTLDKAKQIAPLAVSAMGFPEAAPIIGMAGGLTGGQKPGLSPIGGGDDAMQRRLQQLEQTRQAGAQM